MAVNIRKSIKLKCDSCGKAIIKGQTYDIGIGNNKQRMIITLCDECMHTLLRKLIITGAD